MLLGSRKKEINFKIRKQLLNLGVKIMLQRIFPAVAGCMNGGLCKINDLVKLLCGENIDDAWKMA